MSDYRDDEARRAAAAENLARRKEEMRGSKKRKASGGNKKRTPASGSRNRTDASGSKKPAAGSQKSAQQRKKTPARTGMPVWQKLLIFLMLVVLLVLIGFTVKKYLAERTPSVPEYSDDIVMGLKGSAVQIVKQGDPYIENGAFAADRNTGAIGSDKIKCKGSVNTSEPGEYKIEYTVRTDSGQAAAERTVRVITEEEFGEAISGVPVLMYHWVYTASDAPEELDGNWIQDTVLDEQMAYLEQNKFYFPGWKELRAWVDGEISLPQKSVVVTFDDGRKNFLKNGIPVLEKHHIPATSFMICGGKSDGTGKIREYASPYIDFESHTYDMHQQGSTTEHKGIVGDMSKDEIKADLQKAREVIGNNDAIAYPYGDYTYDMMEAVREAGIQCGFTVQYGRVRQGQDPVILPRVRVLGDESFELWKESVD